MHLALGATAAILLHFHPLLPLALSLLVAAIGFGWSLLPNPALNTDAPKDDATERVLCGQQSGAPRFRSRETCRSV
jgi:hypothetical protein